MPNYVVTLPPEATSEVSRRLGIQRPPNRIVVDAPTPDAAVRAVSSSFELSPSLFTRDSSGLFPQSLVRVASEREATAANRQSGNSEGLISIGKASAPIQKDALASKIAGIDQQVASAELAANPGAAGVSDPEGPPVAFPIVGGGRSRTSTGQIVNEFGQHVDPETGNVFQPSTPVNNALANAGIPSPPTLPGPTGETATTDGATPIGTGSGEFSQFAGLPLQEREALLPESAFNSFLRQNNIRPGSIGSFLPQSQFGRAATLFQGLNALGLNPEGNSFTSFLGSGPLGNFSGAANAALSGLAQGQGQLPEDFNVLGPQGNFTGQAEALANLARLGVGSGLGAGLFAPNNSQLQQRIQDQAFGGGNPDFISFLQNSFRPIFSPQSQLAQSGLGFNR